MFKHILLASDGSKHAQRAAETAAALGSLAQSAVTVLYVIDSSSSKSDVLSKGSKEAIQFEREKKLESTHEILKEKCVHFKTEFVRGDPGPSIVEFANKNGYDLLIVGSRGLNSLQEMVLGSVSHKVAKRVNCPVMIVK
ncbi:universal stress protein [Falsibacillus pallidus]|uniref:Nucleotide-binding universal stress UspA family protein n=1 Tax=Falsibacillus pallidus TaxID=493781 RepID=A0A370GP51_9BACI|nr:universal stress protein [Falsibacillus pallidus]RDI45515.1 nucleotide-binding universal stress UspA family protein [Falsibacillus pallidus]